MQYAQQYNRKGEELPDPTPMELPVGFTRPPTIEEMFARLVLDPATQRELSQHEIETEEEANDFDVPDEMPDPTSPYQREDNLVTESDEMSNGFRTRLNVAALAEKARREHEENKKAEALKQPEPNKTQGEKPDAKN